jgi:hypothetical protein
MAAPPETAFSSTPSARKAFLHRSRQRADASNSDGSAAVAAPSERVGSLAAREGRPCRGPDHLAGADVLAFVDEHRVGGFGKLTRDRDVLQRCDHA